MNETYYYANDVCIGRFTEYDKIRNYLNNPQHHS